LTIFPRTVSDAKCKVTLACPVVNLFIDWNPIYADDYVQSMGEANTLYARKTPEEVNLFAKL
jgi:hypothetical protein